MESGYIPLLAEEGWTRHQSDAAKHRYYRGRGGQPAKLFRPEDFAELTTPSAPFRNGSIFIYGASTPPLRGGEYSCASSIHSHLHRPRLQVNSRYCYQN